MRIDRKKLPVKYALEIYQELPGYPSHSDLEYILVSMLQDRGLLDKDFTAEQIWDGFKHCLGTVAGLRGFLDHLCQPEDPKARLDFNVQGTKTSVNSYRIEGHSWMN